MENRENDPLNDQLKNPNLAEGARDGFDNTGTQGYDSLKDDGYVGTSNKASKEHEDGTGSSSEDFHDIKSDKEDHALDSGI